MIKRIIPGTIVGFAIGGALIYLASDVTVVAVPEAKYLNYELDDSTTKLVVTGTITITGGEIVVLMNQREHDFWRMFKESSEYTLRIYPEETE